MKHFLGTIFLLAAVVAAWTSSAEVEASGRTLNGIVRDQETAQPIPFASVTLLRLGDEVPAFSAVTDAEGKFSFEGLMQTWYRVDVSYHGYQAVQEGLEIGVGTDAVSITISMLQDGRPNTGQPAISLAGTVVGRESVRVLRTKLELKVWAGAPRSTW